MNETPLRSHVPTLALAMLASALAACAGQSLDARHRALEAAWEAEGSAEPRAAAATPASSAEAAPPPARASEAAPVAHEGAPQAAQHEAPPARAATTPAPSPAADDPFAGASVLDRARLVEAVLRRNPSLRAARFAWRAALARFPQETALPDPELGYVVAPASLGASGVDDSHRVDLGQSFPFPGKLRLRGEAALAEAEAAGEDFAAARLRLATIASLLFDDYYLAERALEVNEHHRRLLEELRAVAQGRYEAGEVTAQAPLQAEVQLARIERERAELESGREVTRAQLAALLHLPADRALPPPPAELAVAADAAQIDRAGSVARALAEHPELRAADARVRAGEAAVALARREFFPDVTLAGGYDSFWEASEQRPFVGLSLELPLQLGRRRAALAEASARLDRARSERASAEDEVRLAVESSADRIAESARALAIYRDRLLPAARDLVEAARAAFESGQESFLVVIQAEQDLREVDLGYHEALADLDRRTAELRAATGALPGRP